MRITLVAYTVAGFTPHSRRRSTVRPNFVVKPSPLHAEGAAELGLRMVRSQWISDNEMKCLIVVTGVLAAFLGCAGVSGAQDGATVGGPTSYVFASPGGVPLKANVFTLTGQKTGERRAAIVIFHGGGWSEGEPEWAFARARHFAARGLIAIAAQYRLSDQKTVTPLDTMADARAVIRWMRTQAGALGIDPGRIVADGWSAGAHLAAAAAIFGDSTAANEPSAAPNALVLVSPAVSLEGDSWAQRLLGRHGNVRDISPTNASEQGSPRPSSSREAPIV